MEVVREESCHSDYERAKKVVNDPFIQSFNLQHIFIKILLFAVCGGTRLESQFLGNGDRRPANSSQSGATKFRSCLRNNKAK